MTYKLISQRPIYSDTVINIQLDLVDKIILGFITYAIHHSSCIHLFENILMASLKLVRLLFEHLYIFYFWQSEDCKNS